jgi:hypothetical protein
MIRLWTAIRNRISDDSEPETGINIETAGMDTETGREADA